MLYAAGSHLTPLSEHTAGGHEADWLVDATRVFEVRPSHSPAQNSPLLPSPKAELCEMRYMNMDRGLFTNTCSFMFNSSFNI